MFIIPPSHTITDMGDNGDHTEECHPMYHHQHELPRILEDGVSVTKLSRRWRTSMGAESSVLHREKYRDIYCIISRKDGTITYLCVICSKSIKELLKRCPLTLRIITVVPKGEVSPLSPNDVTYASCCQRTDTQDHVLLPTLWNQLRSYR
jgi:hypothetical protein